MSELPLIAGPATVRAGLDHEHLVVVDLCKPEVFANGHLPGARHLDYAALVASSPPVGGLLPAPAELGARLSRIGVGVHDHVVAYDDEGGGRAARLLWTLDVLGHPGGGSLLDGGRQAWLADGYALDTTAAVVEPGRYDAHVTGAALADGAWILARLGDPALLPLDTRTPAEYRGQDRRAARGGHIPRAVNLNWTEVMDHDHERRLLPEAALRRLLHARGVTPDHEVVTYCQTHHRSSHTYVVLKHLGYPRVRGYPGAWSEWGNRPDTPVETGDGGGGVGG